VAVLNTHPPAKCPCPDHGYPGTAYPLRVPQSQYPRNRAKLRSNTSPPADSGRSKPLQVRTLR
ncbi:hypothetical protein C7212DRAFT_309584, partial [Tuber magnatum]